MSKPENLKCPDCEGEMVPRKSVHGTFWGCKSYPKCTGKRDSNGMSAKDRREEKNNKDIDFEEDDY